MSTISQKICLVGEFGVGKTSLIRRFVDRQFSDQYLSTVGVKISRKLLTSAQPEASQIQFMIWDIEGSTKFKSIAPSYLQGAKGAILVGDLTRPETLEALETHLQSFLTVNPSGRAVVALNKADIIKPELHQQFLKSYALQHSCILATYLTSAKAGDNVDLLFYAFAT
jgi:small GTP-binding protein